MGISDRSSDVCSYDLLVAEPHPVPDIELHLVLRTGKKRQEGCGECSDPGGAGGKRGSTGAGRQQARDLVGAAVDEIQDRLVARLACAPEETDIALVDHLTGLVDRFKPLVRVNL